jgi:hypothetical protein
MPSRVWTLGLLRSSALVGVAEKTTVEVVRSRHGRRVRDYAGGP